jgi:putative ATP-dependent endonuclease of the OLD family
MYIKALTIEGYRHYGAPFTVPLQKGLNVLLGENGCGKTTVIDALRELLAEDEYGRSALSPTDFHRPFEKDSTPVASIAIQAMFGGLSDTESVVFLPWVVTKTEALLTLRVENKLTKRGRYKRDTWGGESRGSVFEPELFDRLNCIYLPPMRDAEAKLREGKGSRLARLLKNLNPPVDGQPAPLEQEVKKFNQELAQNKDKAIAVANEKIRSALLKAIGNVFGQDTTIRFSESNFNSIVESLRLYFFPQQLAGGTQDHFRDLEENSLGYNNLLYLATVLAELSATSKEDGGLRILLIEEPEAHLHPQLQILLLKYLESAAKDEGIQVVVTTHSPVLASAVSLDAITHLAVTGGTPVPLGTCGIDEPSVRFVSRWLDATKSTLLFAKAVILVEGIAEALLLPVLARIALRQHKDAVAQQKADEKKEDAPAPKSTLPPSLEDAGVAVINMDGIYFRHFMQLFCRLDGEATSRLPMRCAGLTDQDPPNKVEGQGNDIEIKPSPVNKVAGKNPALALIAPLQKTVNTRLFANEFKTFEYDLAMAGANMSLMLTVAATVNTNNGHPEIAAALAAKAGEDWKADENWPRRADAAAELLRRIADYKGEFAQVLAEKLAAPEPPAFIVPAYIKRAVAWAMKAPDEM